jgi:hypothetical protein
MVHCTGLVRAKKKKPCDTHHCRDPEDALPRQSNHDQLIVRSTPKVPLEYVWCRPIQNSVLRLSNRSVDVCQCVCVCDCQMNQVHRWMHWQLVQQQVYQVGMCAGIIPHYMGQSHHSQTLKFWCLCLMHTMECCLLATQDVYGRGGCSYFRGTAAWVSGVS